MSNNTLYNGSSEGFTELSDGYIAYAKEVIARRSVSDIRDGLKPVGRRIIYACSSQKGIYDSFTKCGTLVGKVMEIHPHGDSSIYQALCNMADSNKGMNVPIFIGQGDLGSVYSTDKPAAMRYTKAHLSEIAKDYMRDMEACNMVQSEEGEGMEPEVFPVRFPAALVNGTSGMAVSVSTSVPSFNMLDVINLTQERIKTGECTSIITPDFPTGGIIVKDNSELAKIMHTGKGKLKIRAKVEIAGRDILVKEVPYGKTVEGIIRAIDNSDIDGVVKASDDTGTNSDILVRITCKSLKAVEGVLLQLYRLRILQTSFSSSMLFVENEEPVITGVYGVIERWLEWRRQIVTKKFNQSLESIAGELEQLDYFIRLIQNAEWRDAFVDKVVHISKNEGRAYLHEIFEDIPEDVCTWIIDRSLSAFNNGGKYARRFADLTELAEEYKGYIENVDKYIYDDLEELKRTRSEFFERKSEETFLDYRFSKISDSEIEDDSICVYTLYKDGFLTKTRMVEYKKEDEVLCVINAQANSTLIGFDCFGRLLRVFGTDIPFTNYGERGEYLPRYFEADGYEGYRVMYLGLLDGKKRMLLYKDGFVGFLDTSEFVGKKKIRTVQRGVDTNVYNALVDVIEEDDFPEYLVVADDSGKKVKFGVARVDSIDEASRKSRRKVFGGIDVNIRYWSGMSYIELAQFMEDPMFYADRMRPLGGRAVYGDAAEIMKEGKYYEQ